MKTDQDINATNQLIRVIRGETYSMSQEGRSNKVEPVALNVDLAGWWTSYKFYILVMIVGMIFFTFLSVSFLSGEIKNIENTRFELITVQKQTKSSTEPSASWELKEELAERIDSLCSLLTVQRPYVSSLIKEISHILPKNCFLNRLHIFMPSEESSTHDATLTVEATLIDNTPFKKANLPSVIRSIEASPLFSQTKVGYQDRSILFNYRTIDFQLDFSLE